MVLNGRFKFDPVDVTNKHQYQRSWKRVAIIKFPYDEYDDIWRWYIRKQHGLILNQNLRGSHITFINDKYTNDMKWNKIKSKFDNIPIQVELTNQLRSNAKHWWLKPKMPSIVNDIRLALGLEKDPFHPYHYTIGLINPNMIDHSNYVLKTCLKFYN